MSVEAISKSGAVELSEQELESVSGGATHNGLLTNLNQYVSDALTEFLKTCPISSSIPGSQPSHPVITDVDPPMINDDNGIMIA